MLLKLDYYPESFDPSLGSKLSQPGTLNVSVNRLMWSAITVGRDSWNKVVQSGMYSAFEIVYRSALLLANLEMSKKQKIAKSSAYRNLDPSEKSGISYFIGLTCAKLLAQKLFGVNWLMHLDVYRAILKPQLEPGASRPDLVGRDRSRRWLAFEAKGRSGGVTSEDKDEAKGQVDRLSTVSGEPVYLGVGLISYFNSGDKLEVFLKDPPTDHGFSLNIDAEVFFKDYYKLFIDLVDSGYGHVERVSLGGRHYLVKHIRESDTRIGIDEKLYNHGKRGTGKELLERVALSLPTNRDESHEATGPLAGEDGIYVDVGRKWTSRFVGAK